ncbi:hypothetical protein GCM10022382_03520 [Microbacterium invictum]
MRRGTQVVAEAGGGFGPGVELGEVEDRQVHIGHGTTVGARPGIHSFVSCLPPSYFTSDARGHAVPARRARLTPGRSMSGFVIGVLAAVEVGTTHIVRMR